MTDQADALMGIFGFKRAEVKAMDKVRDARRGLFEAWWISQGLTLNEPTYGRYATTTQAGWMGFNAALDAVEIELPKERAKRKGFQHETLEDSAFNACRDLCVDAIESTSLGLRIK